jgi:NagD protein
MLNGVLRRHQLSTGELAVVGDRLYTDVAMARAAGALSVLVLSGETTPQQAQCADPRPDLIVRDVGEFGEMLLKARSRAS